MRATAAADPGRAAGRSPAGGQSFEQLVQYPRPVETPLVSEDSIRLSSK